MAFRFVRVFCSTPGDLEPERQAFHRALNDVNELEGMPRGVLFVPVSIVPNLTNKEWFQSAINENVRECAFFVQLGMNFEREYKLAQECMADPALPMRDVARVREGAL